MSLEGSIDDDHKESIVTTDKGDVGSLFASRTATRGAKKMNRNSTVSRLALAFSSDPAPLVLWQNDKRLTTLMRDRTGHPERCP
jgi:hypothetical protein